MIDFNTTRTALDYSQYITNDRESVHQLKEAIMKDQITLKKTLFDLREGEFLGIFGLPGSGKTTLLRILGTTLVCRSASGLPSCSEHTAKKEGRKIQDDKYRNNEYGASGLTAMEALIEAMHPSDISAREIRKQLKQALNHLSQEGDVFGQPLSRSTRAMVSKVTILSALHNPKEYLLLDEPTRDVSVQSLGEIHDLLGNLKASAKTTVILTTKDPFEAERLCDRIVLIGKGRVIAIGRTAELRHLLGPNLPIGATLAKLHDQLTSLPPAVE
jgi:ABC-type multidrug transport system ATPase subunit